MFKFKFHVRISINCRPSPVSWETPVSAQAQISPVFLLNVFLGLYSVQSAALLRLVLLSD